MAFYHVNDKGNHEVHTRTCPRAPERANQRDLGWHDSCQAALKAALELGYESVDGCAFCCPDCHEK